MSQIAEDDLEALALRLEASGRYRILRQLDACTLTTATDPATIKHGIMLDTETTGVDAARDEVIELALVPFQYDAEGRLCGVGEAFTALREPSKPIPEVVTRITGITDAMVAGRAIDDDAVTRFIDPAVLVIAHNARFDRQFVERLNPAFASKAWACSMTQIEWAAHGFEGTKLSYLANQSGFFFGGHRAENDCLAALEVLGRPLTDGRTALAHLLEAAREPTWRVWAVGAHYDLRDQLKARGYRWNGEEGPLPKAWYRDLPDADHAAEFDFLRSEIYRGEGPAWSRKITAFDRFSGRI